MLYYYKFAKEHFDTIYQQNKEQNP